MALVHFINKKLQLTRSIYKNRADGCYMNFSNMAALVPAED